MRRAAGLLVLVFSTAAAAAPAAREPLTLERIMADPDWIGRPRANWRRSTRPVPSTTRLAAARPS